MSLHLIFIYSFVSYLSFYLIGHLLTGFLTISSLKGNNYFKNIFLKLSVGAIVVTALYALFMTGFQTVYLQLGLWGILFVLYKRPKMSPKIAFKKQELIQLMGCALFLLPTILLACIQFGFDGSRFVHWDTAFYGGIADSFNNYGVENANLAIIDKNMVAPQPYHYFEIWTAALLARFWFLTGTVATVFLLYPLLSAIIFIGIAGLILDVFNIKKTLAIILSFTILFVVPISYHVFIFTTIGGGYGFIKLIYLYIGLLLALYYRRNLINFIFCLSLAALLFLTTFPTILGGVSLFLFILLLQKKVGLKDFFKYISIPLLILLGIFIFYAFQKSGESKYGSALYLDYYLNQRGYIRFMEIFFNRSVKYFLACLPFAVFYLFLWKKEYRKKFSNAILIFFSLSLVGLFVSVLMHINLNSGQFFTNTLYPLWALYTLLAIVYFFKVVQLKKTHKYLLYIWIFFLIAIQIKPMTKEWFDVLSRREPLDTETYSFLQQEMKLNSKVAYIYSKRYYQEGSLSDLNFNFSIPFHSFRMLSDNYFPICISVHDIPLSTNYQKAYIGSTVTQSPFWLFVSKHKLENNITQAQVMFMKEYEIDFLITELDNTFDVSDLPVLDVFNFPKEGLKMYKFKYD